MANNNVHKMELPICPDFNRRPQIITHHIDSRLWNNYKPLDGDIIIGSYGKSGTTWLQQILIQLIVGPNPKLETYKISPWLESRFGNNTFDRINKQRHRRVIKTHLPFEYIPKHNKIKYIYLGRDTRDVGWSLYNHHIMANNSWYERYISLGLSPFPKPNKDVKSYFYNWLLNNGKPFWPYWENINSWWKSSDNINMCLLHYNELLHDTESVVKHLIQFLDIDVTQESLDKAVEYSTFMFMKQNAMLTAPNGGKYWNNSGKGFYNKGKNGIWKDTLKIEEHNTISDIVSSKVGKKCATWLLK